MGGFAALVVGLTFIANLTIGLVVYRNNPKSWTNRLTAGLALIFSLWTVFNYFALLPGSEATRIFWVRMVMLVTTPMGTFTYLLARCFPQEKLNASKFTLISLSLLMLVVGLFALSPWMFARVDNLPNGSFSLIPGPAIILFAFSHLGLTTWGVIILILKYRKAQGLLKKQLFYFLVGTVLTLTLITLTNFVAVVFFNSMQYTFIGPTFTLFQVGFLTYAIIRHRLFDIRSLVTRTVMYSLLLFSLTTLIFFSLQFAAQFFTQGSNSLIVYTLLTLFIALIFAPLKQVFEKLTRNIFYKNPYSSSELLETLGEITRSTLSLHTLGKHTLFELSHTMHLSRGALIINQGDSPPQVIHQGFIQKPAYSANTVHNLAEAAKGHLLIFDELEESPEKMLLRHEQISIVMPLRVKTTLHGLLILGEKASGEIYSQQDIDVLEILMPQLSVAIQNALSYEEIKGFADTLKDEVNNATKDLKLANRHLKHLDKLKDEFVFIATHELKNPVTALRGYLSMLEEGIYGPIPPKMKEPFSQMHYSNQQLVDLVNDLLQIARAEAKTLTIATIPVDIKQLIELVCNNLKPLADQKHLTLTYDKPKKDTLMVMGDEARLKEVLNNLISNAIKYSAAGTITISHENNEDKVITHVQDQGFGIADKDRAKIFTRFFRVEEEAAKGIPGTGLGLFIVKQIVEKMRGRIWFNSVHGKGTIFSFSLPKA